MAQEQIQTLMQSLVQWLGQMIDPHNLPVLVLIATPAGEVQEVRLQTLTEAVGLMAASQQQSPSEEQP